MDYFYLKTLFRLYVEINKNIIYSDYDYLKIYIKHNYKKRFILNIKFCYFIYNKNYNIFFKFFTINYPKKNLL
jgi:hypothetical protein